ncbi:DUF6726 family protein [Sulfurimonas sp.]
MKLLMLVGILFIFSGCFVGTIASLPFKAVGAVVPGPIGTGVSAVGTAVDVATPF